MAWRTRKVGDKDLMTGARLAARVANPDSVHEWDEWSRDHAEGLMDDLAAAEARVEELEAKVEALEEQLEDAKAQA